MQKLGAFTKLFLLTQTKKPKKVLKFVKVFIFSLSPLFIMLHISFNRLHTLLRSVKKHPLMLKYVKVKKIYLYFLILNPSIHRGLSHATPFKPALSQRLQEKFICYIFGVSKDSAYVLTHTHTHTLTHIFRMCLVTFHVTSVRVQS